LHNFWEFKFWQWSRQTKLDMLTMSQNLTDWNIGHKIMHFLTVLLDSMLELNSSQIFLHTFLDSLLSSNWWFSAVFALLVTIFNTSPSFYLSYHFFFLRKIVSLTVFIRIWIKTLLIVLVSIEITVKPVRWTGQKLFFSCHCEWVSEWDFSEWVRLMHLSN